MDYVLKITGKAFTPENIGLVAEYIVLFRELVEKGYRITVVAGGGPVARQYIEMARRIGVDSNYWLDTIAIKAARLNAQLIAAALYPLAYPKPAETLEELVAAASNHKIVVLGGLVPGQSTATVAVEAAEALGVNTIVNAGAIDYVYTKDPTKHPDAKPLKQVTATQLLELLETKTLPGQYELLDVHAIEIMRRSKIKMILTHYKKPENIKKIILENQNPGTIILPE